jgi:hypothetical protein
MKTLILIFTFLLATPAFAVSACGEECETTIQQNTCIMKRDCSPKLRKKDREIAELKKQLAEAKKELALEKSKTPKTRDSYYFVDTPVYKYVDNNHKNSVSLMIPFARTKFSASQDGNNFRVENQYQPDLGIMYQRDFNRIRGTAGLSIQGVGLLGVGYNF